MSPLAGQLFNGSAPLPIIAQAADSDGSIAQVEFYLDNRWVGSVTAGSGGNYQYSWQLTHLRPGKYRLRARATDNLGASTWSEMVLIRVIMY